MSRYLVLVTLLDLTCRSGRGRTELSAAMAWRGTAMTHLRGGRGSSALHLPRSVMECGFLFI